MNNEEFAGASKTNTSFLSPLERRLAPFVLPRIPKWLETYHLTMLTLVWSLLIVIVQLLCGDKPALAMGRVGHDCVAMGNGSLRRKDWQVSEHRAGQVGLLHGSPARLFLPLLDPDRLLIYSSGELTVSIAPDACAFCGLRLQYLPGICHDGQTSN